MTRGDKRFGGSSWWARAAGLAAAALLAACGGGGGGTAAGEGTLRVALTDAPSCGYDNVWVTVEKVRVHASGGAADADAGWRDITVSPARRIDLLTLTNGVLSELGSTTLPAGKYSQIRLVLAENSNADPLANAVKPTGGTEVALRTPSGQQSGLKLQANLTVETGQTADVVLDFDACKSVVKSGNGNTYNLKPVISVAERVASSIQGYVTTTLTLSATTVSAQQGGSVVRSTVPDASGKFVLAFLPPGSYDVVITSDGRSTAVVSSVPVTTATAAVTSVNGTATAIVPPVSTMREITGTASVAPSTTSTTTTTAAPPTLVTDATASVRQTVAGTPVQVASTAVDAELASYRFNLPTAAPVRAPYAATGSLVFTTDTAAAGKYTLVGAAPGRTPLQEAIDFATLVGTTVDLSFAP